MEYKQVYVLSKKYTDGSISGITGTLAGKNCTISSTTHDDDEGTTTIVFKWTADDGTENTSSIKVYDGETPTITSTAITGGNRVYFTTSSATHYIDVMDGADGNDGDDGVSITNVEIDSTYHLIVTLSDGSTIDAGSVGSGTALSTLTDVTLSTLADGDMLVYDASTGMWVNEELDIAVDLEDLDNVAITSVADGDVLKYDSSTSKWVNGTVTNIESINDIDDVEITSATADQILVYDGTNWVNQDNEVVADISDLTDVTITDPTNGQILIYDSTTSTWKNGSASATSTAMSDLSDVSISSLADAQILKWDATNSVWVNATSGETIDSLSDIGDVELTSIADGQVIVWDGTNSKWINADIAAKLSELSDITLSSLADGQVIVWDSTNSTWVNADIATNLSELSDVTLTSLADLNYIRYDSTSGKWVNVAADTTVTESSTNAVTSGAVFTAIETVDTKIGELTDLDTTDQASVVSAVNEVVASIASLSDLVGDLTTLTTSDKTSIVTAINELVTNIGDLTTLETETQTDLVSAINEILEDIDSLSYVEQFSTMPTASDYPTEIVQYTGSTDTYTRGYFYRSTPSVESGSVVYNWEQLSVQPSYSSYEDLSDHPYINSVELIDDVSLDDIGAQKIIQYETMPTASSDNLGDVVQFIGSTTTDYTLGYFYQCQYVSSAYTWVNVDVSTNADFENRITELETNQGDMSTLEVTDVSDIVSALNALNAKGLSTITYEEPTLTLTYLDGSTITFNVRDSILTETQIGELANVTDTAIEDGNLLQYDSSIVGYKPYDVATVLSELLTTAKDYTDEQIASSVQADAIYVDAKPTCSYDSSTESYIVVYYQNDTVYTTSETTTRFYYYDDSNPYCTSWFVTGDTTVDPVEFTYLLSSVDLDQYVNKDTDVTSTYTESLTDKELIPNVYALDALVAIIKEYLALKVNTADIVDNLLSTSTDVPLSANQGYVLNTAISAKQDIIQVSTMPTASADYVGTIYQYIGSSSSAYTQGYFYIGTYDSDTDVYSWSEVVFNNDMEEITASEVDALWE